MKKTMTVFSTLLFSLTLTTGAFAAEHEAGEAGRTDTDIGQEMSIETQPPGPAVAQEELAPHQNRLREATSLMGQNIESEDGKELGTVSNLLFDMDTGQLRYLTISTGPLLGAELKEYVVPWKALKLAPDAEKITLDVSQEKFRNAPEGTELGSRQREEKIFRFYGVSPYWEETEPAQSGPEQ